MPWPQRWRHIASHLVPRKGGAGANITHQQKKIRPEDLLMFRDRFHLPLSNDQVEQMEFFHPGDSSPEVVYLHQQRENLGGYLPS